MKRSHLANEITHYLLERELYIIRCHMFIYICRIFVYPQVYMYVYNMCLKEEAMQFSSTNLKAYDNYDKEEVACCAPHEFTLKEMKIF